MKAFGLEIRKTAGVGARSLFADVDKVLGMAGVTRDSVGARVQQQTVAHSLQHMMQPDQYLCICKIRECAELCGVCISAERMNVYRSQHCVNWNKMLPEFRATICAMILDDFREVLTAEL